MSAPSTPKASSLRGLMPSSAGSLASVLEAIDIQRQQRKSSQEAELRQSTKDLALKSAAETVWNLVAKDRLTFPQTEFLQFVVNAHCGHFAVRFFSESDSLRTWRQQRQQALALAGEKDDLNYFTTEPALNAVEAIDNPLLMAVRDIGRYEVGNMLQELGEKELQQLATSYRNFLRAMGREYTVQTLECKIINSFPADLANPFSCCCDSRSLYVADTGNRRLLRMNLETGDWTVCIQCESIDHKRPNNPIFLSISAVCYDGDNSLFLVDPESKAVWNYDIARGDVDLVTEAFVTSPKCLAFDRVHRILYATVGHSVQVIDYRQRTAFHAAGDEHAPGYREGKSESCLFNDPQGIACVPQLNAIFVADTGNHCIRRIQLPSYEVTTVAGNGDSGYMDGIGTGARMAAPWALLYDQGYNLFFSDAGNHVVGKLHLFTGAVTSCAGSGQQGWCDSYAVDSLLNEPVALAQSNNGNIYVADSGNNAIRVLFVPERPPAEGGVNVATCSSRGYVYMTDACNHRVQMIDMHFKSEAVIAGCGERGFKDGPFLEAMFDEPRGIASDARGLIYVADYGNHRIRRLDFIEMTVTTIAGTGMPGRGQGTALFTQIDSPHGLTYNDATNTLIFACAELVYGLNLSTSMLSVVARMPRPPI